MSVRLSAAREATRLLEHYGQVSPAVDVERIARGEGATVVREPLEPSISGLLLRTATDTVLAVNDGHHPRRQRFTISHEIGHLILHPGRAETVDSTVRLNWRKDLPEIASAKEEREANDFAARLLMPESMILVSIKRLSSAGIFGDERVLQRLATEFNVSQDAMNFRLINLGLAS